LKAPFNNIREDLDVLFEDEDTIDNESRQGVRAALKIALEEVDLIRGQMDTALAALRTAEEARRRAKRMREMRVEEDEE